MNNIKTDQEYWTKYWDNYKYEKIPQKVVFQKYLSRLKESKNFVEIGGFPGIMALFFHKNICKDVTILDYILNKEIINKIEVEEGIPTNTIKCIQADFLNYKPASKYDIVFSYGFIEHFNDISDILKRHVDLLSENGKLLVVLPNLRGLNGIVQKIFDRETYDAHNIESMKIKTLKKLMSAFSLSNLEIKFIGKPMVWIEPKPNNSKLLRKFIRAISFAIKLIPIPGRFLSPFIVIYAENSKN